MGRVPSDSHQIAVFLVANKRTYIRVCPSVRPSVGNAFFIMEFKPNSDLTSINAPAQRSRLIRSCIRTFLFIFWPKYCSFWVLKKTPVFNENYFISFARIFCLIWYTNKLNLDSFYIHILCQKIFNFTLLLQALSTEGIYYMVKLYINIFKTRVF